MDPKQVAAGCLLLATSVVVLAETGGVTLGGPLASAAAGAVAVFAGGILLDARGA